MGIRILRGRLKNRVDDYLLPEYSPETKQADALSE